MVCTENAVKAKKSLSRPQAEKKAKEVEDGDAGGFLGQASLSVQGFERYKVITFSEVLWFEGTSTCQLQIEQSVPTLFSDKLFSTSYSPNERTGDRLEESLCQR